VPVVAQPDRVLAARLRKLRKSWWPDVSITQAELAEALSGRKNASISLISSWESGNEPTPPPEDRLNAIVTFFSTRRSIEARPYRLISEQELTAEEKEVRKSLRDELFALRAAALAETSTPSAPAPVRRTLVGRWPWSYEQGPILLVCPEPELPVMNGSVSPASDPDATDVYRLTDLQSLIELYGHIRAVNPDLHVSYKGARGMTTDDWTKHLVLIGGIDFNLATQWAMLRTSVPVTQRSVDDDPSRGCFQVVEGEDTLNFTPSFADLGGSRVLTHDIGHFFRAPNPHNRERSITVCNGMFGSGVYGAVRALTHDELRDKNADFLAERFDGDTFSLLFRVDVVNDNALTPDWTAPGTVLHAWPEA
jgi:transcriptional regulator with XRE-family HTH domain